ncbi:hypothetical protein F5B18DRAFT_669729 [Nemania serpens]|nr:hypothetical protein F5B18DRAFT_669729 [Nemania serpens]
MASTTIFDGSEPPTFVHLGGGASPKPSSSFPDHEPLHYRLMTKTEWLQFCRGIGVLKDDESEEIIRTTSRLWPPSAFKDGLFSDVLFQKTKFTYYYHAVSIVAWVLMLTQMALSAVLTALGAMSKNNGTPITIVAAINTGISGILALLHNSGLPDRYRWDRNEFNKLEEHIKAIVDTGLVPAGHSTNDVLGECFEMFAAATQTVEKNAPSTYAPAANPKPSPSTPAPTHARRSRKTDSKT